MNQPFSLLEYMNAGIHSIISNALKSSLKNPKESAFLIKFLAESKRAESLRLRHEESGKHIPPFLIASITNNCNLFCKGCYSRANHPCEQSRNVVGLSPDEQNPNVVGLSPDEQCSSSVLLSSDQWNSIFKQAKELGISFILLAGGEPFLRREVITQAGQWESILFPVFTNGTMFDEDYFRLFDRKRNLIPVLSMEGSQAHTDYRRGEGVHQMLTKVMDRLNRQRIFYGVSITITSENIRTVTEKEFVMQLSRNGCKLVFYVEYVPVAPGSGHLTLDSADRDFMENRLLNLREELEEIIFLSFPGDEKYSGGCLAAGRGFLHINSEGSAEPCPFSPYSDLNLKSCTLSEALDSKLFEKLNRSGMLLGEHDGGCTLFDKGEEIKKFLTDSVI